MITLSLDDNAALEHARIIEPYLTNRINNILDRGITLDGSNYTPVGNDYLYLDMLLENQRLKKLLTTRPEDLASLNNSLRRRIPDLYNSSSKLYRIIYNIFIDHVYEKPDRFNKYDFIKNIGTDTCTYCNRNYVYYLSRSSLIKPEIDHFYPKELYPIMGMSYYNLIPSCQTCNGLSGKKNKDPEVEGLRNPYLLKEEDFVFSYKPKNGHILNAAIDKDSIEVYMKKNIPGHLTTFHLADFYVKHADHVLELIVKSKVRYSKSYRKYLKKYSNQGLKLSDHEINRMILGNYTKTNEIHLRPLSKLYQDIGKELGLI